MDKNKNRKAISRVKLEDEAQHERNIGYMDQDDDEYKSPWKEDAAGLKAVTDSSDLGEITFKKPAARKEPQTFIGESIYGRKQIRMQHRQ